MSNTVFLSYSLAQVAPEGTVTKCLLISPELRDAFQLCWWPTQLSLQSTRNNNCLEGRQNSINDILGIKILTEISGNIIQLKVDSTIVILTAVTYWAGKIGQHNGSNKSKVIQVVGTLSIETWATIWTAPYDDEGWTCLHDA